MATTTPPTHDSPLKSVPRKLPIKRKTPSASAIAIAASVAPNSLVSVPLTDPLAVSNGYDAVNDDEYDEDEEEEDDDDASAAAAAAVAVGAAAGSAPGVPAGGAPVAGDALRTPPPFKFHRIWSESDEIRFLQGLLGCWSQGMVFPRDLNLFYDRFSESMPQPYTRSQLSEKLRRLRKKFRVMSARIARGQDPSRLAPHDRDLLHLCTRLWHPSYAASSPFSAPDASAAAAAAPASGSGGSGGNKRRRPNPRAPSGRVAAAEDAPPAQVVLSPPPTSSSVSVATIVAPSPAPPAASGNNDNIHCAVDENKKPTDVNLQSVKEEPQTVISNPYNLHIDEPKRLVAKAVLDVFDECLKELQGTLIAQGLPHLESSSGPGGKSDLEKRWKELRLAEMNALSRRLRLVLENSGTKLK